MTFDFVLYGLLFTSILYQGHQFIFASPPILVYLTRGFVPGRYSEIQCLGVAEPLRVKPFFVNMKRRRLRKGRRVPGLPVVRDRAGQGTNRLFCLRVPHSFFKN